MLKYILLAITLPLFTGCAFFSTPMPEASSEGALVYANICGSCHALAHPKRNTYTQWKHLVGVMEIRMAQRQTPPMSGSEKRLILEYLKKHSR